MNPDSDPAIQMDQRRKRLDVYPLRLATDETDVAEWTDYHPPRPKAHWWSVRPPRDRQYAEVTRPVRLHLTGYRLLPCHAPYWRTAEHGWLDLDPGYTFSASGGAFNDPLALMGAAVHDPLCSRVTGADGTTHPLPSYWARHALYCRIVRAQGGAAVRVAIDWLALVACNWWVDMWQ